MSYDNVYTCETATPIEEQTMSITEESPLVPNAVCLPPISYHQDLLF